MTTRFTRWAQPYSPELARSDLGAGLTVGAMLVPQAMAYALLAGLPPEVGLYAATVPVVVYAALGSFAPTRRWPGGNRVAAHGLGPWRHRRRGKRWLPRRRRAARDLGRRHPHRTRHFSTRVPRQLPVALGARWIHRRGGHHHRLLAGETCARHLDRAPRPLLPKPSPRWSASLAPCTASPSRSERLL